LHPQKSPLLIGRRPNPLDTLYSRQDQSR